MLPQPRSPYIFIRVSRLIIEEMIQGGTSYPGAYAFWFNLSTHHQRRFIQSIQGILLKEVFNDELRSEMMKACLNIRGMPSLRGKGLYDWMRGRLYAYRTERFMRDWMRLSQGNKDEWTT